MNQLQSELAVYRPGQLFDAILPKKLRHKLITLSIVVIALLSIASLGVYFYSRYAGGSRTFFHVVWGVELIFISFSIPLYTFTFFYNTLYFRGMNTVLPEDFREEGGLTMEVASIAITQRDDLTKSFMMYRYGREILLRAGLFDEGIRDFLASERTKLSVDLIPLLPQAFTTLEDVATFIYETDAPFANFLRAKGIKESDFLGAASWVSRVRMEYKKRIRWWSRDNLGRVRGIGRELSYGVAFNLRSYMRPLESSFLSGAIKDTSYANAIIHEVEGALTREKASNALLIGEKGAGALDMLVSLGKRMKEGDSLGSLMGKRLIVFDTQSFIATHNTKQLFETAFLKLFSEAQKAGHIIVVLEDIPGFLKSADSIDVDLSELLERFLESPDIQIVGTSVPALFHGYLEKKPSMLRQFALIYLEDANHESSLHVLEEASRSLERKYNLYFTYQSLKRIVETAEQYIVEGVMPDKALSILSEIAVAYSGKGTERISADLIDEFVSAKTGIPLGPLDDSERNMLLNLEDLLHERVVGQNDAIKAIADTMRRARAGIQNAKRPIGTFLFLGSTGVGKTETAKAFAHVFFGDEKKLVRFDMSEYSDESGLIRLLGSENSAGALPSALREHPYTVILLDEFEKASGDVHDLFLQILDEGIFTDARGAHVNARNAIIIATSNAGSARIYELIKEGKRPMDHRDDIIDDIVRERILRPELINRFDATILFETLGPAAQEQIAHLMLEELKHRIAEKGYSLELDPRLVAILMEKGFDPEFGARPMRRAIQDVVEATIAKKILHENVRPGGTITLTVDDTVS